MTVTRVTILINSKKHVRENDMNAIKITSNSAAGWNIATAISNLKYEEIELLDGVIVIDNDTYIELSATVGNRIDKFIAAAWQTINNDFIEGDYYLDVTSITVVSVDTLRSFSVTERIESASSEDDMS